MHSAGSEKLIGKEMGVAHSLPMKMALAKAVGEAKVRGAL
jgi:hypothetical protein